MPVAAYGTPEYREWARARSARKRREAGVPTRESMRLSDEERVARRRESNRRNQERRRRGDPEYVRESNRAYYAANPEPAKRRAQKQKVIRRARLAEAFVEHVEPLVVLELADGVCGLCGEDVDPFDFHVDHIVPLARGGEHSYANTQPACPPCNQRKGARGI